MTAVVKPSLAVAASANGAVVEEGLLPAPPAAGLGVADRAGAADR
jgi:hypothetical protein